MHFIVREANFLKKYISKFRTILQLASGDRSSGEQAGSWERLISVKNDPEIHPSDLIGVITLEGWAMFLYHWQDRMWRLRSLGGLFKELAQLYLRHIPPSDNAHNYMACWICSYGESVTQCEVYKHISVAERQIVQDAGSAINRNPALSGGIVLAKSIALFNDRLAIPPLNYKAKSYEAKAIHLPRIEVSIQEARQSIASMKKDLKRLLQNCIEEAQGVAVSQPHQVQRARQVSIISQFMQNLA